MITILALLLLSTAAFSRDERDQRGQGREARGEISLNDGKNILRIDIGNDRDEGRDLTQRIIRLERAVRELQNRVYDLEDDAKPSRQVKVTTCILQTPFDGVFIGKGVNEIEARANAVRQCSPKVSFVFCSEDKIKKCEETLETINN